MAVVVDLCNANAAGIAFENRRRVITAFSEPGKPNHTGRTEVQGAYLPLFLALCFNHLSWGGCRPYSLVAVACRRDFF
jgi:small subunit ribosomal protein S15